MNKFDIAIYAGFLIAVVGGFNTGLVRSAITILACVLAMPITVGAMSYLPSSLPSSGRQHRRTDDDAELGLLPRRLEMIPAWPIGSAARRSAHSASAWSHLGRVGVRPAHSARPRARLPEGIAAAADLLGPRAAGVSLAEAGGDRRYRAAEARAAYLEHPLTAFACPGRRVFIFACSLH
jgi:hypothetical protein